MKRELHTLSYEKLLENIFIRFDELFKHQNISKTESYVLYELLTEFVFRIHNINSAEHQVVFHHADPKDLDMYDCSAFMVKGLTSPDVYDIYVGAREMSFDGDYRMIDRYLNSVQTILHELHHVIQYIIVPRVFVREHNKLNQDYDTIMKNLEGNPKKKEKFLQVHEDASCYLLTSEVKAEEYSLRYLTKLIEELEKFSTEPYFLYGLRKMRQAVTRLKSLRLNDCKKAHQQHAHLERFMRKHFKEDLKFD